MKRRDVKIRVHRTFTEQFKKARVKEYETGQFTVKEISDIYSMSIQVIYGWIYKYSIYNKKSLKVVEYKGSSQQKLKEYQERIKSLEQIIGQKQLNIDYLEKMIELTKETYDIDIKKNFDTLQSGGSIKTNSQ